MGREDGELAPHAEFVGHGSSEAQGRLPRRLAVREHATAEARDSHEGDRDDEHRAGKPERTEKQPRIDRGTGAWARLSDLRSGELVGG